MGTPVTLKKYSLVVGENTFASPSAGNQNDARKLQSLIPSLSGALEREHPKIAFDSGSDPITSRIGFFHQFKRNNSGTITYFYFCATNTTLYQYTSGAWKIVSAVGSLADFPVARNINNQMQLDDGTNSWLFDGANWIQTGLAVPQHRPSIQLGTPAGSGSITSISRTNGVISATLVGNPTIIASPITLSMTVGNYLTLSGVTDSTFNGIFQILTRVGTTYTFSQPGFPDGSSSGGVAVATNFNIISNRYYWTTFSDQSATHPHESSSGPISRGTGAFTVGDVFIFQRPGTVAYTASSTAVVGTGTDFDQNDVGQTLFNVQAGFSNGIIASVQDAQHLTLVQAPTLSFSGGSPVIAPARTTHINFYASATEEDKVGQILGSLPVGNAPMVDQSPMLGTAGFYLGATQRPVLNDPPVSSKVMEVFKNRLWRRLESSQNYFAFSGNEEILAENAGTPSECVPGASGTLTRSTGIVNLQSLPDQGAHITGIRKHGDALFLGTEENVTPLYGSSLADFSLSEAQAFAVGFAGRKASVSTPFGLAFLSYDLKVYLYPSQYSFGVDSTTALVELGRPKRPEFEQIDGTDFPNVDMVFYNWGRRNWLVLSYRRTDQTYASWVFDFEAKAWFQLQQGYTAVTVFEMTPGRKSLIGAGPDFRTYVIDDLTGNFPPVGNYPLGTVRFLIDYGQPDQTFVGKLFGYETSNAAMEVDVTFWLDPVDPDNPGQGNLLPSTATRIGANSFICRPNSDTGATFQRILLEFAVASNPIGGTFHGFTADGDAIPNPVI